MTPMQEQYNRIKSSYKDFIVLFRLGDFYETFEEDAIQLSKVLGITLTSRGKNENKTPLAGIPYHSLNNYMPKLVEAGLKIVIAEQMEEAKPGKLVEREVTKVITPGTVLEESSLDGSINNFIGAVFDSKKTKVFVYGDVSTGELSVFYSNNIESILNEVKKISPKELLIEQELSEKFSGIKTHIELYECKDFEDAEMQLKTLLDLGTLKGLGLENKHEAVICISALLAYIRNNSKADLRHFKNIKIYDESNLMQLDEATIRNLELLFPQQNSIKNSSIYDLLNRCKTPMGRRKLRNWIIFPLKDFDQIQNRLDATNYFYENPIVLSDLQSLFASIADLERIATRIAIKSSQPRDLNALKISLSGIFDVMQQINNIPVTNIKNAYTTLESSYKELLETCKIIDSAINPNANNLGEGDVILTGYDPRIDEIRELKENSKSVLNNIQKNEIESTGIPSLKISFNSVFGYFIEVTKTHANKVPAHYIRKQTLANAERYITEELKVIEEKLLSAESNLYKLEAEIYRNILDSLEPRIDALFEVSKIIAELDIYLSFAEVSRDKSYTKPELTKENLLEIRNGRHPVIENIVKEYVSNDSHFDNANIIKVITGPNMSGKSTYIRQNALIVLMAQIGCMVPADSMKTKVFDRIFTRVGASDNLSKGESTFMVEMSETANILNSATKDSLIILDEIGRGTSTYDGVAIAWSIIEYIFKRSKAFTLFATHYHELSDLEKNYKGVVNYNVDIKEEGDKIEFLHKIVKGSADRSYGVYVAKISGVPEEVTDRAEEILKKFESGSSVKEDKRTSSSKSPSKPRKISPDQLGLI